MSKQEKTKDISKLLPLIEWSQAEREWQAVVPISALKGDQVDQLLAEMVKHLPEGEPLFADDELTDQSVRSLASEIVREKILEHTGEEIPYVTAVMPEKLAKVPKAV